MITLKEQFERDYGMICQEIMMEGTHKNYLEKGSVKNPNNFVNTKRTMEFAKQGLLLACQNELQWLEGQEFMKLVHDADYGACHEIPEFIKERISELKEILGVGK